MPGRKTDPVAAYILRQPDAARAVLARVRVAVRRALPRADEAISYGIPTYKVDGRPVIYFAAWKKHYSIYPVSAELLAACGPAAVRGVEVVVEKGTIRLPYEAKVPVALITKLAKRRLGEVAGRSAPKAKTKPRSRQGDGSPRPARTTNRSSPAARRGSSATRSAHRQAPLARGISCSVLHS